MELQREEMEKVYSATFKGLQEGEILRGKVLSIRQEGVIVDIGTKREGFIPAFEFSSKELKNLKQGNEIDVYLITSEDADDFVKLSKQQAVQIKTWQLLEDAYHEGRQISGEIVGKVKGGLKVVIEGVDAFLPGSQIDIKTPAGTDQLVGQTCSFKVLNINSKRSNVIVSRRLVLEEEREKLKQETLGKLEEGLEIQGTVKNITDYGAFVDLGGIDGLLHISDMSWGRISHPGERFRVGESVGVVVLKFDRENEKVTLGYKQKKPDPWSTAEEKYPAGRKVSGKIINIVEYGIFVELEEGVEGLVHITELDWVERIKKPSKYFSVGDVIEAMVLQVNASEKKVSLSIRQLKPNPWDSVKHKYQAGQRIKGVVKSFTDFGAFISLPEGIDSLLHISDMSWAKHVRHPSELLKKGQTVEVVVLSVNPEKERIGVGLKQLTADPWVEEIPAKYRLGDTVKGKVVKISNYGLFVAIDDTVEGLIYTSEIEKAQDEKLEDIFQVGTELTSRIIKIDPAEKKIGLSMKTAPDQWK